MSESECSQPVVGRDSGPSSSKKSGPKMGPTMTSFINSVANNSSRATRWYADVRQRRTRRDPTRDGRATNGRGPCAKSPGPAGGKRVNTALLVMAGGATEVTCPSHHLVPLRVRMTADNPALHESITDNSLIGYRTPTPYQRNVKSKRRERRHLSSPCRAEVSREKAQARKHGNLCARTGASPLRGSLSEVPLQSPLLDVCFRW